MFAHYSPNYLTSLYHHNTDHISRRSFLPHQRPWQCPEKKVHHDHTPHLPCLHMPSITANVPSLLVIISSLPTSTEASSLSWTTGKSSPPPKQYLFRTTLASPPVFVILSGITCLAGASYSSEARPAFWTLKAKPVPLNRKKALTPLEVRPAS